MSAALADNVVDIATIVQTNPVAVLSDPKTYERLLQHIKGEALTLKPDLATDAGRKKIAALAYRITRTKTAIDSAGKELNEDARAQIAKVDAQRRVIREDLDALAKEVRRPLTEWEEAEALREETVQSFFRTVKQLGMVLHGADSASIRAQLETLDVMTVDESLHRGRTTAAREALETSRRVLRDTLTLTEKAEENARELEMLRAEQLARQKADAEAAAKAEAEKQAREDEERAAAKAARLVEEAYERARLAEQQAAEREKKELIEAQERLAKEQAELAAKEAAEQAKREANKRHRASVIKAAKQAIVTAGPADAETARNIVDAIIAGHIPNVTLRF